MILREIHIRHFGRFTDRKMSFHEGINVIYGPNETGKSTIHAFIRAMLYGLERKRGRTAVQDEYMLRKPWDNGSYFAGSLRFEHAGLLYRLDRSFSAEEKYVSLVCESTGEELNAVDSMAAFLDHFDETAFCSTLFFDQQSIRNEEELISSIRKYLVNARDAGVPGPDVEGAKKALQKKKKELLSIQKRNTAEQEQERQKKSAHAQLIRQEIASLEGEADLLTRSTHALTPISYQTGKVLMLLLAASALAGALILERMEIRAVCVMIILLACLVLRFFTKKEADRSPEWQEQISRLYWVQDMIAEKQEQLAILLEESNDFYDDTAQNTDLNKKLSAISLALQTLEEAASESYQFYAARLNDRISRILAVLTQNRYTSVFLDEDMQVKLHTPERVLQIHQVSRGTMEQVYFAIRMAALDLLNTGEPLPLLLDDVFASYDDVRLTQALGWMTACGHQVLLFTCRKREQEILNQI